MIIFLLKSNQELRVCCAVSHTKMPEAGKLGRRSRPAWGTHWIPGQSRLEYSPLFQKYNSEWKEMKIKKQKKRGQKQKEQRAVGLRCFQKSIRNRTSRRDKWPGWYLLDERRNLRFFSVIVCSRRIDSWGGWEGAEKGKEKRKEECRLRRRGEGRGRAGPDSQGQEKRKCEWITAGH